MCVCWNTSGGLVMLGGLANPANQGPLLQELPGYVLYPTTPKIHVLSTR